MAATTAFAPFSKACSRSSAGIRSWMPAASSGLSSRPVRARSRLEPGGQFELSGAPLETIHQTCREGNAHLAQVREIAEPMGIRFLGLGGSPKWTLAETPRMPKSRYDIMTRYMPKVGTKGLDMMYRTCTIQVNLDFESEADMRRKMQVSLKLQPLSTALFANSPFTEGRPNGFLSWRGDIWRDTDNQRSGLLEFCFSLGFRLFRLCRLGARRADVFRHPRRPLPRHDAHDLPPVHGRRADATRCRTACRRSATGRTICRRCFPTSG